MSLKIDLERLRAKSCASAAIDEATAPNMLTRAQADRFIDLVVDNSVLLKNIRVVRTNDCKGEIGRLDIGEIISEGACATSCPTERTFSDSYITYNLVKYRSATSISQDFLDCNILGDRVRDEAINMIRKQVGNDMEMAAIESDSTLPVGDNQSAYNNLMGVNDGFIAMACACVPDCQVIDAAGAGPSPQLFMEMRRRVPVRYRARRNEYRYVVGPQVADWWVYNRSLRDTVAGDAAISSGTAGPLWGVSLFEVPLWPENLPFGTAGGEGTVLLYTPMQNMIHFIQRQMSLEWERRIRCDDYQATMYWKSDWAFENPDMVVVVKNLDPCGEPYAGCSGPCNAQTHTTSPCA
jgi:hypothetical protein